MVGYLNIESEKYGGPDYCPMEVTEDADNQIQDEFGNFERQRQDKFDDVDRQSTGELEDKLKQSPGKLNDADKLIRAEID